MRAGQRICAGAILADDHVVAQEAQPIHPELFVEQVGSSIVRVPKEANSKVATAQATPAFSAKHWRATFNLDDA